MTRQESRFSGSAPVAAIALALIIAIGVSIIAHSLVLSGAWTPFRILATLMMSPGCATFGTRMASG